MIDKLPYFWLSFADPDLPKGKQFLGVIVIKAIDFLDAIKEASGKGINPGGEVVGNEVVGDLAKIPEEYIGRLLTRDEAQALDAILMGKVN